MSHKLVTILGPTASGKTALSVAVAQRLHGEIISGDSMQVYRRMDIGTAKVTAAEQQGVPHHLLDILEPQQAFSVADFRDLADAAIADISGRGRLPIVAGGTGLYISALLDEYDFAATNAADLQLREQLKAEYAADDGETLYAELQQVDPPAAERIHRNDAHRLLRALEVYRSTGQPLSASWNLTEKPQHSRYQVACIGLTCPREVLYSRIEKRVDIMMEQGLLDEVKSLLKSGVSADAQSMQGIGYRQLVAHLEGQISLDEAVELIKRDTRRFAKRQQTWFKRDVQIAWFDITHYPDQAQLLEAVLAEIGRQFGED